MPKGPAPPQKEILPWILKEAIKQKNPYRETMGEKTKRKWEKSKKRQKLIKGFSHLT